MSDGNRIIWVTIRGERKRVCDTNTGRRTDHSDALVQAQPNSARKQGHGTGDRQTIVHEKRRKEVPG